MTALCCLTSPLSDHRPCFRIRQFWRSHERIGRFAVRIRAAQAAGWRSAQEGDGKEQAEKVGASSSACACSCMLTTCRCLLPVFLQPYATSVPRSARWGVVLIDQAERKTKGGQKRHGKNSPPTHATLLHNKSPSSNQSRPTPVTPLHTFVSSTFSWTTPLKCKALPTG